MDDELSAEECEFFVRRLQRDHDTRNLYMRYQLIGAAIRGEHINPGHDTFRNRLQTALTDARGPGTGTGTEAPRALSARAAFKAAAGIGIAASVALVAIFVLRAGLGTDGAETLATASPGAERRLERVETPSYVVPLQVPPAPIVSPEVRLTGLQYLMHHSGHAAGFSRTVVHSNVLSSDSQDIIQAVEATAQ